MTLIEKIDKIFFDHKIGINKFSEKTGISKSVYYSIQRGDKTELSPLQIKQIVDAYPDVDPNWFGKKFEKVSILNIDYIQIGDTKHSVDAVAKAINDNLDKLEKNTIFKLWKEKFELKAVVKVLQIKNEK